MKRLLIILCAGLLSLGILSTAGAAVLTFDDISDSEFGVIPDGYGGFSWENMWFLRSDRYPNSGYNNGTVSGNYVAYNYFTRMTTVYNGVFNFTGAYFTGAWNNNLNIELKGLLGGAEVFSDTILVDVYGPTWFSAGYTGIDQLIISSYGGQNAGLGHSGTQFAMDNFSYTYGIYSPVPEPATIFLLGAGFLGMAGLGRRKFSG